MHAQFLLPPMLGLYLVEAAGPNDEPIRPCLIIAWDDHSENYLVVDRQSGEQRWLSVASVQIDADSLIATLAVNDTQGKACETHKKDDDEEHDPSDFCPVCKQRMP